MKPNIVQHRARAFEHLFDAVVVTDMEGRIIDWNPGAVALYGYEAEEAIGRPVSILHAPEDVDRITAAVFRSIEEQGYWTGEIRRLEKDGSVGWIESLVIPLEDEDGEMVGAIGVNRDITARKEAERELQKRLATIESLQAELKEQALRDPLTGLYNIRYLDEFFGPEIARSRREGRPVAVVLLDLDRFKDVNDTHGHRAGDEVLRQTASLLVENTREMDVCCRYGGEEFLVLMPGATADDARRRAEGLRRAYEETSFVFEGATIRTTLCAGIAVYPEHGGDLDTLLAAADRALYRAKAEGRNRILVAAADSP